MAIAALILSICPAMLAADTPAEPPAPDLSHSLVVVIAEGQANGVKRYAHATGFFIDKRALIATSNHIRTDLGDIDPGTFKVSVYADETSVTPLPAQEVMSSENTDVMVLQASVGNLNFVPLRRGDSDKVRVNDTTLYTAGYPAGMPHQQFRGYVTSLTGGPVASPALVWATSFTFTDGQSGSPVVDTAGRVVGIVRGSDSAAPSIGFVVPAKVIDQKYWSADQSNAAAVPTTDTSATLVASGEVAAVDPRARRVAIDLNNVICAPPTTLGRIVRATEGWRVVPGSMMLSTVRAVGAQSYAATASGDQRQISVQVKLTNVGNCVRVYNNIIYPDTPSEWHGELDFTEAPQPGTQRDMMLTRTPVVAGRPISFPAANVSNLRLAIEQPDGTTRTITPSREIVSSARGVMKINTKGLVAKSMR